MCTTTVNAGFFTDVLSGATANALTGSGGNGYKDDGSAKSYFVILNKKINLLDVEIKILLGINILILFLLAWVIIRQRKILQNISLQQKKEIEK